MAVDRKANDAALAAIDQSIRERGEIGVQVAAYLHGELVVDAWGGTADPANGRPVDGDTLFNVFSVSKGVVATALHVQAERGLVNYDRPVADYWPEYGANGKAAITVRQAMTHCTGTPHLPDGATLENAADWNFMCAGIAALEPLLPIGGPAYQAISYGWVVGEIVRRTDPQKRAFEDFVREELCEPFGIEDLRFTIDAETALRVARLSSANTPPPPPAGSILDRAMPRALALAPEIFDSAAARKACIPAVGGVFNARSAARFWGLLANGGALDGKRLLSRERIAMACKPSVRMETPDPVFFGAVMPISAGGYWLNDGRMPITYPLRSRSAIGAPGHGGSLAWADLDTGLAIAFCHNHMSYPEKGEDQPASLVADAIRDSLDLK